MIADSILCHIFDGGCVSKSVLLCMPYSYRNTSVQIKKLLDSGYLQLYDKGKLKRYRLLGSATDYLFCKDELRYVGYENVGDRVRTDIRSMTLGDTIVLMKLAGYGVNHDDKPMLPTYTGVANENFDSEELYYNQSTDESCRYVRYETPVNCFYSSTEVKRFAEGRAECSSNAVQYSRITGFLYTPDCLYRTYHTRSVAMDFRFTGEENVKALIPELFTGRLPNRDIGTLIFGYSFEAAKKILEQGLDAKRLRMARINGGNQLRLNGSNLSQNLLYFPVQKEIVTLLRFMSFPGWQEWLNQYIAESLISEMTSHPVGFFLGELDGYNLFNGLYMNLTHFSVILNNLHNSDRQNVAVLCFDWQKEFYETMLNKYTIPTNSFEIYELAGSDFKRIAESYEKYWRG